MYGASVVGPERHCGGAAYNGHEDVVKILLERGADPDKADIEGLTALSRAVIWNHKDVVKMLINAGADLDKADKKGRTPLHFAAYYADKEMVSQLLQKGADHKKTCNKGLTPLKTAENRGHSDVVKILREPSVKKGVSKFFNLIKPTLWKD